MHYFDGPRERVSETFAKFFSSYSVVQMTANGTVLNAGRDYAFRLRELRLQLESLGTATRAPSGPFDSRFVLIAQTVRDARHDTIEAIREDSLIKHHGSSRPQDGYNPFDCYLPSREEQEDPTRTPLPEELLARSWRGVEQGEDRTLAARTLVGFPVWPPSADN